MRWALYDLRSAPPSFDFLAFIVLAKYHGAQGVWFIPGICERKLDQYNVAEQKRRLETIVFALCDLYGMTYKVEPISGKHPKDFDLAWPPYARAGAGLGAGYMIGWLRSIKAPEPIMPTQDGLNKAYDKLKNKKIVCHLRGTKYQGVRNSGPDWGKWAKDHDAYLLKDEPISVDERVAFHELASLNIGVNAGPMALSEHSVHRPYLVLKKMAGEISTNIEFYAKQGWYPGDQYPWAGKHQRIVWDDRDDYEAIETAYKDYCGAQ